MGEKLSPFVYWGQKSDIVSLKVDLREVIDPAVDITEDALTFCSEGHGVQGQNRYQFHLNFYLPIDPEKSKYRITERGIEFHIAKKGAEVWPRLTEDKVKYAWLKIDFDKVYYEESEEEQNDMMSNQEEMMKQLEKELKSTEPDVPDFKIGYLFLYNLFQFIGFTYITVALIVKYTRLGEAALKTGFETVGTQLMVVQAVAVMEIVHPLLGIVKTSAIAPFLQVLGRNFSLFVILYHEPRLHTAPAVFCLFFVWSAIECFRYPFYMLSTLGKKIGFITWLRYTAWIPLYPLGILLEGTVGIMAIPLYEDTEMFTLQLPNSANMAFYFPYLLHAYLFLLLFGGYQLLNYMYSQRKKVIGVGRKKKSA
ncbi:HACD [Mytilus coruscus]|uniref:Very-long-chain (3R)-3-hydroxyacyl-CoA dehydratase n=1 Tax=Mytilus coruscus TaxID=42192 RepID=A0A6J8E9V9_MYTCO|nr:HACD [Mytilus coruscus]